MGSTKVTNRGVNPNKLTDKMMIFCLEYIIDFNGTRSAKAAKYKQPSVKAAQLLKHPAVKAFIGKKLHEIQKKYVATAEEVLEQLTYCALGNAKDYADENGRLVENIHDLPERAQKAIDGIEQTVKTRHFKDGSKEVSVKTKFRGVSKTAALDMMLRHKGLFAVQEHSVKVAFDWDTLVGEPKEGEIETVEQRLEIERKKLGLKVIDVEPVKE